MGRKTLLAAALAAALTGLVACGTTTSTGTSAATTPGRATATGPAAAATPPPRPVAVTTRLPSGIHVVKITLVPGLNDKTTPPGPVTVTTPAKVGQLVALVNGLSVAASGVHSCPMDDGRGVRLTFLSAPGGAPLATAFAAGNGCGGVTLTVGARSSSLGSGDGPAQQALAIGGIRWNVWGPA